MKFYKVRTEYEGKQGKPGYYHVGGELLTAAELKEYGFKKRHCDVVDVADVYWFFGARFAKEA